MNVSTMSDDEVIRAAMSLLGKRTSDRKKLSSRANAKRPRKRKKLSPSEYAKKVCSISEIPID